MVATYRVQLNREFRFADARAIVPFLRKVGVTHLYCSPILQARPGSSHGYDVTDPTRLNEELGGDAEFEELVKELHQHGMGMWVDIVPNHMAASGDNSWWLDVLENGPASPYAAYFSVEWEPASSSAEEKIFLPILGEPFGSVLEQQQLQVKLDGNGLHVMYWSTRLPIDPATYLLVLGSEPVSFEDEEATREWEKLTDALSRIPSRLATDWDMMEARLRDQEPLKRRLWELYSQHPPVRNHVDAQLSKINGQQGDPASFDALETLLQNQPYRVAFWRAAREKINYRRFFDVSELISIRSEDPQVFNATHKKILELVQAGAITGLRIDHIDGLFHPREYLERLREAAGPQVPVAVEKITLGDETLPTDWPAVGTTGYDFLAAVNDLFVDDAGLTRLDETYRAFTGSDCGFRDTTYATKKQVIDGLFAGEMASLGLHLSTLAEQDRHARDLSPQELAQAILEVTACFPVYRTYTESPRVRPEDRAAVEAAVSEAESRNPKLTRGTLNFNRRVLLMDTRTETEETRKQWLRFVMRWQQMTGPIMAKGVEDTAFYRFNRLISMNEVGSNLAHTDVSHFHRFCAERQQRWPGALNATSTHDTKRSEDVRARINVISELADDWNRQVSRWTRWNREHKSEIGGRLVPDASEEYLVYQTLLGAWPLCEEDVPALRERVKAYLEKALREAKVYTSWRKPDPEHEQAVQRFAEAISDPLRAPRFFASFRDWIERTSFYGAMNSLSQVLLKVTCPGVPDFYQGTFTWDLSLVDPDNRRPVPYEKQAQLRQEMCEQFRSDPAGALKTWLLKWTDGKAKLFTTQSALQFRQQHPELFAEGKYLPLTVTGPLTDHLVAFLRRNGEQSALIVVPRRMAKLSVLLRPPLGRRIWRDTALELPADTPTTWRNVFTGERCQVENGRLEVAEVFRHFPVGLLAPLPQ